MQALDGTSPAPPPRALLWDLDNVTTKLRGLAPLAAALSELTGTDGLRYAAARRGTYRSAREILAEHGFEALSGGTRRDGADRVLLAQARLLHRAGVEHFIVVSNDHRFSRVAAFGHLHVVTSDATWLSSRLVDHSTSVTRLIASAGQWRFEPVLQG